MTITDKVVVITGASSGIGRATARHLAERGAVVVLGARREQELAAVVAEITAAGPTRLEIQGKDAPGAVSHACPESRRSRQFAPGGLMAAARLNPARCARSACPVMIL